MAATVKYAALFIDFENVYYFLKNRLEAGQDANDALVRWIRKLRIELQQTISEQCIVQHAYADFERVGQSAQSDLYLLGVESHHVLSTDHKNAADMRLCIDALETMYTRPEIQSFVFVAGDRDYIPVIQHLKTHARTVRVVAFKENTSGDLLQIVGEEYFLEGARLLASEFKLGPERRVPVQDSRSESSTEVEKPKVIARPIVARRFSPVRRLSGTDQLALEIMLKHFGEKPEVWMTPFLHRLRDEMPQLEEFERKALISNLAESGVIAIEKRQGTPSDYSVMVVNWDHPDVRELNPG